MRRICLAAAALLALDLSAASAAMVYVPAVPDGSGAVLRLTVANDDTANRRLIATQVPVGAAGPHGGRDLGTVWVAPRQTRVIDLPLDADGGLLTLDMRPGMTVAARLVQGTGIEDKVQGVPVPVIDAPAISPRGGTQVFHGLARTRGGSVSRLAVLNLGMTRATCSATVHGAGGHRLGQLGPFEIRAQSALYFDDALARVGVDWGAQARATVSCDQPFSAVHEIRDRELGPRAFSHASRSAPMVYVPAFPDATRPTLRLTVANHEAASRRLISTLVPAGSAGASSGRDLGTTWVGPGRTQRVDEDLDTQGGLLALDIRPGMTVEARVLRGGDVEGEVQAVPVSTAAARDAAPRRGELVLHGLARTRGGSVSHLAVLNLGSAPASCSATIFGATGHRLGELGPVTVGPAGAHYFLDALAGVGQQWLAEARANVTCNQPFFAVHELRNRSRHNRVFRGPAAAAVAAAAPAPPQPTPPPPPPSGGGSSVVFTRPGLFHAPVPGNPVAAFNIPVGAHRTFSRVHVSFDYFHGGWHRDSHENHSLFWLQRGAWLQSKWLGNIYGFVNMFGPGRHELRALVNVDSNSRHGNVVRNQRPFDIQPGRHYRVTYTYDGAGRAIQLQVTDKASGARIGSVSGSVPRPLRSDGSGTFFVYFGHENGAGHGPERPSYGSRWSDLRVEFVP